MNYLRKYNNWLKEIAYGDKASEKWLLFFLSNLFMPLILIFSIESWSNSINENIARLLYLLGAINAIYIVGLLAKTVNKYYWLIIVIIYGGVIISRLAEFWFLLIPVFIFAIAYLFGGSGSWLSQYLKSLPTTIEEAEGKHETKSDVYFDSDKVKKKGGR